MDTTLILSIFVPAFLLVLLGLGGVKIYQGNYYKSLPGELDRLQKAFERISNENVMLKDMVIGKAELTEIIGILRHHDEEAENRHETSVRMIDTQHSEILGAINKIKLNQARRAEAGNNDDTH